MSPSRPASSIAKHAPVQGYMRVRVRVRVRVCMYERKRVNVCESVCVRQNHVVQDQRHSVHIHLHNTYPDSNASESSCKE